MIIDSRYKVIKKLGAGLWATVYKVEDLRDNEIYALKLFQMLDSESLYEKFSAENMHHITKIQHPNLIHVSNFGNFGKHVYYLSEYFKGKTLTSFKFKKTNLDLLYDIIVQICYALSSLHSQNIIHHDLKPENVVYRIKNNRPVLKVMDYGFTKIDVERGSQKVGKVLPYIAPEVYLGKDAVTQSDFYSLGAILYKMTTGTLPYTVEQISAIMAGDQHNLFPKFPRELNPDIPEGLEQLILKLLEKDPQDRFQNVEGIISHVNAIQVKKYPYSRRLSIVNMIQFSDYIVRENYAHQLLDYVPIMERGNGKIISLSAGKGLGKNNVLTLFRYHLLTDKYYIFDYECSPERVDPFFALIKEFYNAVDRDSQLASDLANISNKFKEYLFESEERSIKIEQNKEQLELDFQSASKFIYHLSETKPLIFIIRAAQLLPKEVFEFVNYITREVPDRRILIILSTNDPRKLEGLIHSVRIKIDPLNIAETKTYVNRLLREEPPTKFAEKLWERSFGNPLFIEKILIDLTYKKKFWYKENFNFKIDLEKYKLPNEIYEAIEKRVDQLSATSRKYLAEIAALEIPVANDILKFLLKIDDKELFFFLKEALDNELLYKQNEFYYITFREIRAILKSECKVKRRNELSRQVLKFFDSVNISLISIAKGVIVHAESINNFRMVRKYKLLLIDLYSEKGIQEEAFNIISEIVELDFSKKIEISSTELKQDLKLLLDKSEWTTIENISASLKKLVMNMPEIAEKHLIIGIFYYVAEKYSYAQRRLEKALKISMTGYYRIYILLKLSYVYFLQGKMDEMKKCIDELGNYELSQELMLQFITYKSLYLGFSGALDEGIQVSEDFLPNIKTENDPNYFIRLGNLHNILGLLYHKKKFLDEADKNFEAARKIWEKVNYKRKLGISYNNIGDIALIKGDTTKAFEYFRKALRVCSQAGCKRVRVQGLLNHGEAYIKLGLFNVAETYLYDALKLTKELETKPFMNSIINNLAISKSKINNFSYYYDFIKENVPDITRGNIYEITPLTKTYFYYLYEIGDYNRIEDLLQKYEELFLENMQQEFYYQMLGFLRLKTNKYDEAFSKLELAFNYSKENESDYALTINYLRMVQCYVALEDHHKAYELCKKAESLCSKHNFRYWDTVLDINRIKIQLLDETVSLRPILRKLLELIPFLKDNRLFLLEIEVYELIIQIYSHLNISEEAEKYFTFFKQKVEEAVVGLPDYDKAKFFKKKKYYLDNFKGLRTAKIVKRMSTDSDKWQEELFDILKLRELTRMKFLIDKTIQKLFSPAFYSIVLKDEFENQKKPFINADFELSRLYSKKYFRYIKSCIEKNTILQRKLNQNHVIFVPLKIKTAEVGCLILADSGEIPFQEEEKNILKILRLHLTSIMLRINEFAALNNDMELMSKLVQITRSFFSILNVNRLEQEIVSFAVDFAGGSRGFLIKKDKYENYVYKVALDDSKQLLKSYAYISKTILIEVQQMKQPVFIENVLDNKIFESYIDHTGSAFSVYCAPIIVDGEIQGYLYIDDFNSSKGTMKINPEFMKLLLIQISVAFKNAMQYENLMFKNQEISSLDTIKKEFINIASHELNTPISAIQGYLKNINVKELPEAESENISKTRDSILKLKSLVNDLLNFNKYQLSNKLDKQKVSLKSVFQEMINDMEKISTERHMNFRMEFQENLPQVSLNLEAFKCMIKHILINSVRFTKDFGTITLGARSSAFQQEEVEGNESVVIYIQDNGIGIPENELSKIFEKFYELGDIISHKSGFVEFKSSGLGLGLSIVKLIVELHNGKIWINSKEHEGTTVFVALPY
ncbi:MAG: protein kinase [Candidatus Cloacimonetes bacterium]|nr:protein kinase [Candidatus Cloacimonadota bacterium]MCF7812954.1 protein kinase [Candidatus Cloacimonadota bacterium]MCF7867165.1 protein kinase [Candidatus Cloacimonadota bacterium]MCF7882515.1 protein kinase [Candidatus Cloacimonadota bacterium]